MSSVFLKKNWEGGGGEFYKAFQVSFLCECEH